jgi:uncharacterized protein YbjT (DUF2867 family)
VLDVVAERGYEPVAMSRTSGVDVITREGLAEALTGVDVIIDAAASPSPDAEEARRFYTTAASNLQEEGERAGVKRIVVVSIIGCDRFEAGYNTATFDHEQATLAGSVPARVLRAAQFHELVEPMMGWATQDGVTYVPEMRSQPVAARNVAEALVDEATAPELSEGPIPEVAGPRVESFVELARMTAAKRGNGLRVELTHYPDPDRKLYESDGLLPSPHAKLVGPTYEEWLAQR